MTPRPAERPNLGVLALIAVFAMGALVTTTALRGDAALSTHTHVPWWLLAVGFGLCEIFVVHIDRGRHAHTFSLMEIPLVVGLYLVSPVGLVAARLAGSGVALAVHRRQPAVKLAFNLSLFGLETALAAVVFRSTVGTQSSVSPASWAAAFLACLVANLMGALGVTVVIRLVSGRFDRSQLRQTIAEVVFLGPAANTSLALCATVLLWYEAAAAWLLMSATGVVVLAYRAYSSLNHRYANLERLYEFTRETYVSGEGDDAVVAMLDSARRLLDAEQADLVLVTGGGTATRTRVGPSFGAKTDIVELDQLGPIWPSTTTSFDGLVVASNTTDRSLRDLLTQHGWRDCVAVPFHQQDGRLGLMSLANRAGDVSTFNRADLALFAALVNHAVVSLERSKLLNRVQYEALHDALTGLPNRMQFNRRVEQALADRCPGEKLAVLLMDLDRFKEVNDTLGHHCGDELLIGVGQRLADALPEHATVARLGGDEFAVLLPVDKAGHAVTGADRVVSALRRPFQIGELALEAKVSIGIAMCPDHGENAADLLQRADVAMYGAKASGFVEVYSPERDDHTHRRLALVSELRSALEERRLDVWYQPQADARTGAVTGVEALLRWDHAELGWVPPDEFIPLAEQTGLIDELTAFVLDEIISQWKYWERTRGLGLRVAVNLSMRNLQSPQLVDEIVARLQGVNMPASSLILEITESSIMTDPARTLHTLARLSGAGIGLAVDDFGTGYSSLTYLRQLPVREVKIDKSFVIGMDRNDDDAAIVRSVIDLGRNLGLSVVAEGVESAHVWRQLAEWGCQTVQGYYLSRAVPAVDFLAWMDERQRAMSPTGSAVSTAGPASVRLLRAPTNPS